jgi:hypothetical protein
MNITSLFDTEKPNCVRDKIELPATGTAPIYYGFTNRRWRVDV